MEIQKVGVAGCGLMGGGIVQVCAQSGYEVVVLEAAEAFLDKGMTAIRNSLTGSVARGKLLQAEMDATLARVRGTTSVTDLAGSDIVIEAVVEDLQAKRKLFSELDSCCAEHTLFCSNTSSIPIIEIAAATKRPDRFVGLHFFNPVPVMKLVEVIRTLRSSDEAVRAATAFAESLGKKTIQAKDRAGFVVNLLLVPYLLDAVRAVEAGVASPEDIDAGMVLGCGYPMGPLQLIDLVGIDTSYLISRVLYDEFKDPKYAAPPLLKQMVAAGLHGRKTGRGFYDYAGR
ncbi:MAG: 3-hydroxybutyryl-CoA dehydrogenase [Deltaproteobacteria bacterium]|nr:3-hydroxybutyryl-CoA dehydrogenase [Deltaproteobacteria bacterium]